MFSHPPPNSVLTVLCLPNPPLLSNSWRGADCNKSIVQLHEQLYDGKLHSSHHLPHSISTFLCLTYSVIRSEKLTVVTTCSLQMNEQPCDGRLCLPHPLQDSLPAFLCLLILSYSVIRGEKMIVVTTVFSYVSSSMTVRSVRLTTPLIVFQPFWFFLPFPVQ